MYYDHMYYDHFLIKIIFGEADFDRVMHSFPPFHACVETFH